MGSKEGRGKPGARWKHQEKDVMDPSSPELTMAAGDLTFRISDNLDEAGRAQLHIEAGREEEQANLWLKVDEAIALHRFLGRFIRKSQSWEARKAKLNDNGAARKR